MSSRLLALVPLAVAINAAMGFIVNQLGLPVYLDAVGTVLAVVLAGRWAGVAVGVLSQVVIASQVGVFMLAFAPIQVLIALLASLGAGFGGLTTLPRAAGWGAAVGFIAGSTSSVISYFVFQGVTATGVTWVATVLRGAGFTLPQAVVIASVLTDVVDKTLVFVIVAAVVRALPSRIASRLAGAARAGDR